MKKIKLIILSFAKAISFLCFLVIISILIVSIKMDNEKAINPYCKTINNNTNFIIHYPEIKEYSYDIECSTVYYYLIMQDNIDKEQTLALLTDIMVSFNDQDFFMHFQITGEKINKPLFASINFANMTISYTGG